MTTNYHTALANGAALTQAVMEAPLAALDSAVTNLGFKSSGIKTISSGIITMTSKSAGDVRNYFVTVAAETGTADNLDEIANMIEGDTIMLVSDVGDTITVRHNTGSSVDFINFGGQNIVLDDTNPILYVMNASSQLVQLTTITVATSIAILRDEKSTTTEGGSAAALTWNARDLNTVVYDPDNIVTIASNKFTPVSGTFEIYAAAPSYRTSGHRLRLYNVTQAAIVTKGYGLSMWTRNATENESLATLRVVCTANGTDEYRIDHYTVAAFATSGLGTSVDDGNNETYLEVVLRKLS